MSPAVTLAVRSRRTAALALLLLSACLSMALPVRAAPAPTSATIDAQGDTFAGRHIETFTRVNPHASASIVFENGSRATIDSWSKVIDALGSDVSIFAYNRPGVGRSEQADSARDGATIVEELRALLKQKGLKPPYILVGHSLGGLYMQLFARRYPDEASGLVLVDALYPGVIRKPEDFPLLTRGAKRLFLSRNVSAEIDLAHQTGEQVLALAPIDAKPILQLINKPTGATAIPVDFGVVDTDPQVAASVRNMYPAARRIVLDSDHQMQRASPVQVAEAIRSVIAQGVPE